MIQGNPINIAAEDRRLAARRSRERAKRISGLIDYCDDFKTFWLLVPDLTFPEAVEHFLHARNKSETQERERARCAE